MIDIHLHGKLKNLYPDVIKMDVSTPVEAMRALCSQVPNFEKEMREGYFTLVRGSMEKGVLLTKDTLDIGLEGAREFHIVPQAQGATGAEIYIIYGIMLAVAVYAISNIPKVGNYEERNGGKDKQSHIFNGAVNTTEQGQAVPIVYGKMRVGSVTVSAGLSTTEVPA